MQENIFKLMRSLCAAVLLVSGCSYEHPGPIPPDEAAVSPTEKTSSPSNSRLPSNSPSPSGQTTTVSSSKKSLPGETVQPNITTVVSFPAIASIPEPLPRSQSQPQPRPVASPTAATPPATATVVAPSPGPSQEGDATAGLYPASETPATDMGSGFDNIEIIGDSLNAKLTVLRVGSQPTANNLLSVFAGLKNKSPHLLEIEIQTVYKDKAGKTLNAGSWIPVNLMPREETEYHSTSISTEAVDFLIRVRQAQGAAH